MSDLISIIIPVYNSEEYITDTLNSIVAQSYFNLEIIIINDGSTDNSLNIIKDFEKKDSRIRVVDKKNEGLSVARECGISLSRGAFFVTIDADDIINCDYIKKMYYAIMKDDADIALCARKAFDQNGEETLWLSKNIESPLTINNETLNNKYNFITGEYQMSDSWNKMYKKSFVISSDVHFTLPRQYNGTDLLFNYSLILHMPKIVAINEPLYYYRLTQNSRVRRKNKHLEDGFKHILGKLLEENTKCSDSKRIRIQIYAAYFSMIKYATQNLSEEIAGMTKHEKIACYKSILDTTPILEKNEAYDIFCVTHIKMKFFLILLLTRNAKAIFYYYKVRSLCRK